MPIDPFYGAALGAIGNLAGGLIGSSGQSAANAANLAQSWQMLENQQNFSAAQAQKQMDFQERMSNTSWQRGMADMKAAGLNPILAYQQGGASSPVGSMGSASGSPAHVENALQGLGHGVTSAAKGAERMIELQQVKSATDKNITSAQLDAANVDLSKANTALRAQETATSAQQARKAAAETENIIASADNPAAVRNHLNASAASAYETARYTNTQREQLEKYGPHWTGQAAGSVGRLWTGVNNAVKNAKPAQPVGGRGPDDSFPRLWNRVFGK